ncbi:HepT-like ribonuclease domain-containing protein [Paracidovorax citrulli]
MADYLGDILEAISRIARYTAGLAEDAFHTDDLVQDAVIRNLEVIGEACRNIARHYPDFALRHPELPLTGAYEMRNALAHGYFKVDTAIVWRTVQRDLPGLSDRVEALRACLAQPGGE